MHEINQGGHTVVFYDSAENLPIRRFQKYNKHVSISCEVGENLHDYDLRLEKAYSFIKHGMIDKALVELQNNRQCVHNIFQEYSPQNMALACLVFSIDKVEYTGNDSETLSDIIDKLDQIGFTKQQSLEVADNVGKKFVTSYDYISLIVLGLMILVTTMLILKFANPIWIVFWGILWGLIINLRPKINY